MQALYCLLVALAAEEGTTLVQGTEGSRSDFLEVHAGGVVVREKAAGFAFGTVKVGGNKRQLSYVVIFKHNLGGSGKSELTEEAMAEGARGESKQTLTIDGKAVKVEYGVTLNARKRIDKETLTVNKKAVDAARGRVFLVDLTVSPPKWEQVKAKLPAEVGDLSGKKAAKAAEALAKEVVASLVKESKKVKAFVEKAGR
jgi:hypothetical protein